MALYDLTVQKMTLGTFAFNNTGGTLKVQLINTTNYTFSQTHDFFDDIPSLARIGTAIAIPNPTVTIPVAGTVRLDADDVTLTAITGTQVNAVVIFKDTGTESTSPLVAYSTTVTTISNPSNQTITVTFDALGIGQLVNV
jgi:hypothetical protein